MTFPSPTLRARMTGRPVYVAGPYRADTEEERLAHVARANRLANLVVCAGGVCVPVHASIAAGIYGDPSDADPVERLRGTQNTLALAMFVRNAGGLCVALTREDGTLSEGTRDEVALFDAMDVYPVYPSEICP